MRVSPTLTLAIAPTCSTPAMRLRRSSTSHGMLPVARSPPAVRVVAGWTTTCVAATASKVRAIWPAAVCARPIVTTSEPMPSTVPMIVSTRRPGRAPMPCAASASRSRRPKWSPVRSTREERDPRRPSLLRPPTRFTSRAGETRRRRPGGSVAAGGPSSPSGMGSGWVSVASAPTPFRSPASAGVTRRSSGARRTRNRRGSRGLIRPRSVCRRRCAPDVARAPRPRRRG